MLENESENLKCLRNYNEFIKLTHNQSTLEQVSSHAIRVAYLFYAWKYFLSIYITPIYTNLKEKLLKCTNFVLLKSYWFSDIGFV